MVLQKEYDLSLQAIARFAEVELIELADWNTAVLLPLIR
jgi:hypothetical protein